MNSIARYNHQLVKINDKWEAGGIEHASIEAIQGTPFMGGDKWPVQTKFASVPASELQPANLLELALAYQGKPQWYSGEIQYIWGDQHRGAYLSNDGGFIHLHITGYDPSLLVYWLSREGWAVAANLAEHYQSWAHKAAREVDHDCK
jgi:hypothetical protein